MAVSRQLGRLGPLGCSLGAALHTSRAASTAVTITNISARRTYATTFGEKKKRQMPFHPSNMALPVFDKFVKRHIGPDDQSTQAMLKALDPPAESLESFVAQVIPPDILSDRQLFPRRRDNYYSAMWHAVHEPHPEPEVLTIASNMAGHNHAKICFIGQGYYKAVTPGVIKRNILENPAWYTSYTPYQPEISQGRLESLLNFQTMVSDLTGLPISNASLLDEGTAAAEALTMSLNALPASRARRPGKTYVISQRLHPQTKTVLRSRAEGFGVRLVTFDPTDPQALDVIDALGDDLVGVMVQYPDTYGQVQDNRELAELVHKHGALLSAATDLLALTILTPPGEWGADIAFGNSQRFGVPLGFGGPHAAFFAVQEKHKRKMPGRLVGVSKDRLGNRALRLALQTREQHIRREKATSNVCTAQALLANMSAMYAVYHGPEGLRAIAERCNLAAKIFDQGVRDLGYKTLTYMQEGHSAVAFDTVMVYNCQARQIYNSASTSGYQIRYVNDEMVGVSMDETVNEAQIRSLLGVFADAALSMGQAKGEDVHSLFVEAVAKVSNTSGLPEFYQRKSSYLTHPVFNTHHSETELLRYIHHLQSKDLSLVHSMIPLGSCTMKLNATTEMQPIGMLGFANLHPFVRQKDARGYKELIQALEDQLKNITAMDGVSLQPNSGAQGEFAGLRAIRKYHESRAKDLSETRDVCLIPVSAHGTNPASAAMAGMRVAPIKCDPKTGNLDLEDLKAKCEEHKDRLGAIMITYPSTFGVFEPKIKEVCEIVHSYGGQVYMDGANMNAQIGLCSPGEIGADVCHLNLHKTFCIPHGGGGPGVGPICVKQHLVPFLPTERVLSTSEPVANVSSAPFGSASILPISWAYNTLMGKLNIISRTYPQIFY